MRVRWRGLELPSQVTIDKDVSSDTFGRFYIEPFERGFGTTVGNSLRRILLSSLEGAAVTAIKVVGAPHEFTSLDGVYEDTTDIVLNVKNLIIKMEGEGPKTIKVSRSTKGEIKAGDIVCDPSVTIINKEMVLVTLTDNVKFEMELVVNSGRGYITAAESVKEDQEIGVIPVDALFSPVSRVRYQTEDTRVGQKTNYDRLVMDIWTKGTITPEMALVEAAKILRKHLNPFIQLTTLGEETVSSEGIAEEKVEAAVDESLRQKLQTSVQELQLSVRATNCLESANITTVAELVQKAEGDLLKVRSFGKTSLREVKRKLSELGLSLGMSVPQ
ncbi:MAG: DNA-directed RNA polymerase subunit alpha [Phycisphaerae bacterium]|nr:DNA-directed RNA polymerase subunit alpha [Phycisphaerae bacterium]